MWINHYNPFLSPPPPIDGLQTRAKASCHGALFWQQLLIQGEGSHLGWLNEMSRKEFLSLSESGLLFLLHWPWLSNPTAPAGTSSSHVSMGTNMRKTKSRAWLIYQDQSPGWVPRGALFLHLTMWDYIFPNCFRHFDSGSLSPAAKSTLKTNTVSSRYFICIISFLSTYHPPGGSIIISILEVKKPRPQKVK